MGRHRLGHSTTALYQASNRLWLLGATCLALAACAWIGAGL